MRKERKEFVLLETPKRGTLGLFIHFFASGEKYVQNDWNSNKPGRRFDGTDKCCNQNE